MAKIPGLFQRRSKWYLRIVIPKDLIQVYAGRFEIRKSLNTTDYSEAKQRANVFRVKMDADFAELRSNVTSNVCHNPLIRP